MLGEKSLAPDTLMFANAPPGSRDLTHIRLVRMVEGAIHVRSVVAVGHVSLSRRN